MSTLHSNELKNESSPYLLQHAHNPVNWKAWNEETLALAKRENKPMLISIGYSACHWCHVMEKESFEDPAVAELMNKHFVCIKVDREEHPDVDQIYMDAVQLLTRQGGWPLNCFAFPDGRPFYGGTYFPKDAWIHLLNKVAGEFENNRKELSDFADKLTSGTAEMGKVDFTGESAAAFSREEADVTAQRLKNRFDTQHGGLTGAPKFPMPSIWRFLLEYGRLTNDTEVLRHVQHTLNKMARGGIYDQIRGGFARYSVDEHWKIPHFEKMLYDNAQLIELFTSAYNLFKEEEYKRVALQSIDFLKNELRDESTGGFYSALDADSEGEEGKFYTWTKEEFEQTLGDDAETALEYFGPEESNYFENERYVLMRSMSDEEFIKSKGLEEQAWTEQKAEIFRKLKTQQNQRVRPALDDKVLTSWNALTCSALTKAAEVFDDPEIEKTALSNASFLLSRIDESGKLYRSAGKGRRLKGTLEDYALTCSALIDAHRLSGDTSFIEAAVLLCETAVSNFSDSQNIMFYFTDASSNDLPARKTEIQDNVIPASCSVMAHNLFRLGRITGNTDWMIRSRKMLSGVYPDLVKYPAAYSNWGILLLHEVFSFKELVICGSDAKAFYREILRQTYPANILPVLSRTESGLSILKNRYNPNRTTCYVCENGACKQPVHSVNEALKQL